MGFSDSFKKALGQFGDLTGIGVSKKRRQGGLERGAGAIAGAFGGNPLSPLISNLRTSGVIKDNRTSRLVGGILAPSSAINQVLFDEERRREFKGKTKEFFGGKESDPPPVGKRPSQGAGTVQAKAQARQRALREASRRRGLGLSGTVQTTPLGLQGDGAATSRRRLIGG